jgi:hypothetical protein
VPEDHDYRLFEEERIKYVMEIVDSTDDVRAIEKKLGKLRRTKRRHSMH